jgi:hypothetical protein
MNTSKIIASPRKLEDLYAKLLKRWGEGTDRASSAPIVAELEAALDASSEFAESIRGEEVRSLIAEVRGDLPAAIHSREAEIRKILQLHALSIGTPTWKYVAKQYDFGDVSDRLDLLAILYDQIGEVNRAIAILRESKQYCASHQIEFDGQDLLDELLEGGNGKPARPRTKGKSARVKR